MAENLTKITPVSGVTIKPETLTLEKGKAGTLTVAVLPDNASDPSLRVSTVHRAVATAMLKENTVTVNALEKGTTSVVVMSDNGNFVALAAVTVNVPAA